jgi:hypothetical protein
MKDEMEEYVMGLRNVRYQNCFDRAQQHIKFLQASPWFHETGSQIRSLGDTEAVIGILS